MTEPLSSPAGKAGMPPGSLVHVGESMAEHTRVSVINFNKTVFEEREISRIDQLLDYQGRDTVTWVIVEGLSNVGLVESLGAHFNIHPLVLEDVLNTHQRPKLEEYADLLYCVTRCPLLAEGAFAVNFEQVSVILMDGFVFTFKEKSDVLFQPIIKRLRNSKGTFRGAGADYIAYVIFDTVVDQYFEIVDALDELTESIEEELLQQPATQTLGTIQRLKRELIHIRRTVTPLRELFGAMLRLESPLLQERTKMYVRDIYDHVIRVSEALDSNRDMVSDLLDIYISSVNYKMNEIMKVLTVFASIFIPLTFLTGIYGMNFEHMPELAWPWAYPLLWVAFVIITVAFLVYFKRKQWL